MFIESASHPTLSHKYFSILEPTLSEAIGSLGHRCNDAMQLLSVGSLSSSCHGYQWGLLRDILKGPLYLKLGIVSVNAFCDNHLAYYISRYHGVANDTQT